MKFKVLRGQHSEGGETYRAGDVVDSASDLNRHNSPGAKKFEQLEGGVADVPSASPPATPAVEDEDSGEESDDLDDMTVVQLKTFAEEEEIDLAGVSRKDEILSTVRAALEQ